MIDFGHCKCEGTGETTVFHALGIPVRTICSCDEGKRLAEEMGVRFQDEDEGSVTAIMDRDELAYLRKLASFPESSGDAADASAVRSVVGRDKRGLE